MSWKEALGKIVEYSGYVIIGLAAYDGLKYVVKRGAEWHMKRVAEEVAKSYKKKEDEDRKLDELVALLRAYMERKKDGSSSSYVS